MAGGVKKVGAWLGLIVPDEIEPISSEEATESAATIIEEDDSTVTHVDFSRPEEDTAKIVCVQPVKYADAKVIGEHYLEDLPVVVDLSEMAPADAKRLVDFSAGLTFGTSGALERVTKNVFLLTPEGVKVSEEDREQIANTRNE